MRRDLVAIHRQLAAEREHRRAIEKGLGDASDEIGRARAERRDADAGDPARSSHGVGHERRGGLVAGEDELEPGGAETLDEIDHLAAGMAHDVTHARRVEPLADQLSDGADQRSIFARVSRRAVARPRRRR